MKKRTFVLGLLLLFSTASQATVLKIQVEDVLDAGSYSNVLTKEIQVHPNSSFEYQLNRWVSSDWYPGYTITLGGEITQVDEEYYKVAYKKTLYREGKEVANLLKLKIFISEGQNQTFQNWRWEGSGHERNLIVRQEDSFSLSSTSSE